MKYTIEGFSQRRALELGLTSEDLLILRWIIDFIGISGMKEFQHDGKTYYWIDYTHLLNDLPILNIKKRALANRLSYMVKLHVLDFHLAKNREGTYSAYCKGNAYESLIREVLPVASETTPVASETTAGLSVEQQRGCHSNDIPVVSGMTYKDPSTNYPSTNNPSTNNPSNARAALDVAFDQFWSQYPKKVGKPYALKAFKKIKPDDDLLDTMLMAISRWKCTRQWTEAGGQYIPNPATWLNQERWNDEVPETVQTQTRNSKPDIAAGFAALIAEEEAKRGQARDNDAHAGNLW